MRSPAPRLFVPATAFAILVVSGLVLGLVVQAPASVALRAQGQQSPTFQLDVDVVSLNITVTDQLGHYVTDLEQGQFMVFEDGASQDLTLFNKSNLSIALSLLLDTSSSMEAKLGTAQDAAIGFVDQLRPQDLAEVVDFDSRVEVLQSHTDERDALHRAIRRTAAGGSTSLYNAVYIALKGFQKLAARQSAEIRRQALVLLSDGEDTSSLVSLDELLELARRSETAIFCVGLQSQDSGTSRGFREATFALRQLANETGGRAFFIDDIQELAGVYGQISDELSSQYTVGYSSKNVRRDGTWRRVVVRVDRPKVHVRTKPGYYAPTSR